MKDIYALIDYYGTRKSCEMSQMILKIKADSLNHFQFQTHLSISLWI